VILVRGEGVLLAVDGATRRREENTTRLMLPAGSPFSDPWMSEIDNRRGKAELGATYTPLAVYLTALVEHYRDSRLPAPEGYRRRSEELGLANGEDRGVP
jgi:hypothetical protein